jgi:hypothetical protein
MARAQQRILWADAQFVVYLIVLASLGFLLGNIHGCSRHSAAAQLAQRDVPFHLVNSISAYASLCAGHASRRFSMNLGGSVVLWRNSALLHASCIHWRAFGHKCVSVLLCTARFQAEGPMPGASCQVTEIHFLSPCSALSTRHIFKSYDSSCLRAKQLGLNPMDMSHLCPGKKNVFDSMPQTERLCAASHNTRAAKPL